MTGFYKAMLLCGAAAMIGCGSPALAKNVRGELASKQQAQAALEKKSKEIQSEVGGLKTKLVASAAKLRETETQIYESDKTLKELQQARAETMQKLREEHDALGGLLAAAGKYSRTPKTQLLMLATPLESARAARVMKTMIPALHEHADALKKQITEMARIERDIAQHREQFAQQQKKIAQQQGELSTLLQERQIEYQKTESNRKQALAEVAQLAKEAKSLEDLERRIRIQAERERTMARRAPEKNVPLPSNMVQPVAGTLHTGFGQQDELGATSEGLTFATRSGAAVVTPLGGKVKFAGPFQKYKQILIIEHPGGYHSLIAGLGRIDTVVGARLAAGEPVGSAESGDNARIYYELRRGGEPVNPRNSMVAQRKQDKS